MSTQTQNLHEAIGRIESKIDTMIEVRKDHEERLRKLEIHKWIAFGGLLATNGAVWTKEIVTRFFTQ